MRFRTSQIGLLIAATTGLVSGCAHRRESYYPPQRGVHVRAPFVDVQVPAGPRRIEVDARRSPISSHEEPAFDYDEFED